MLGLAVGAVAGLLFAPDAGAGTRRKLSRRMRDLREFAGEKADEVRGLLEEAGGEEDEDEDEAADDEPESVRAELERRLAAARRRRKSRLAPGTEVEEEDEPVA